MGEGRRESPDAFIFPNNANIVTHFNNVLQSQSTLYLI